MRKEVEIESEHGRIFVSCISVEIIINAGKLLIFINLIFQEFSLSTKKGSSLELNRESLTGSHYVFST